MRVVLWGALAAVGISAGVGLAPVDINLAAVNQSYRTAIASVERRRVRSWASGIPSW